MVIRFYGTPSLKNTFSKFVYQSCIVTDRYTDKTFNKVYLYAMAISALYSTPPNFRDSYFLLLIAQLNDTIFSLISFFEQKNKNTLLVNIFKNSILLQKQGQRVAKCGKYHTRTVSLIEKLKITT